ncbi:hypothetical protein [Hyalangium versicolor]|uniref:hypothetical protein n=1 Tax=Hyalangium versicolor TaxID=2861190 RepID=UPI001CCD3B6E|nr:hypothetical protein [Hyalangium versicolor]
MESELSRVISQSEQNEARLNEAILQHLTRIGELESELEATQAQLADCMAKLTARP